MTDHNAEGGKKVEPCCAWCGTYAPYCYCPKDGCIGQMLFEEAQEAILPQRRKDFEAGLMVGMARTAESIAEHFGVTVKRFEPGKETSVMIAKEFDDYLARERK